MAAQYAGMAHEGPDPYTPEDRHTAYKALGCRHVSTAPLRLPGAC